jgi:phosphoribosyl 1,2-cyclic phosphodiesterase
MIIAPLGSGSAGNCHYIESDGTAVLIDAGFGPRETQKRLQAVGKSLESVRAILVTHEHYDHIRGAQKIAQKYSIPIYLTRGTLDASEIDRVETPLMIFDNNSAFRIGELYIHARRIVHDAADPACFVVEGRDGTRVGYASDLGHVDDPVMRHLQGCDALLFESNHDVDMLREGTYPWSLKKRIMSRYGHLSNDDAMRALERMIGPELRKLVLIHLSEKNNHETIVRRMAETMIDRLGAPIVLDIAEQREPIEAFELSRASVLAQRPLARHAQLSLF